MAYSSRPWLPVPCLKTECFQPDASPGEDLTVSIVDDDRAVRDALWQLMDSAGLAAEAFASAEEFLASPSFSRTTCLILDVRMPGMDGLELQRRLVATGWKVPIVFISAHADDQIRAQALQAGAFQFFDKPFSSTALLEAIAAARLDLDR